MLGDFVDDYTVYALLKSTNIELVANGYLRDSRVVDVFAMPQSGTGVSVEAVDYVYQTAMMDRLKQTGR